MQTPATAEQPCVHGIGRAIALLLGANGASVLVHDLSADPAAYHLATGVREHQGRVWLGSLEEPAVAVVQHS